MLVIPLRSNEFDDRVFGLLQTVARFFKHHTLHLGNVGRGHDAGFVDSIVILTSHTGQRGFDVQQCTGDIHQRRVTDAMFTARQFAQYIQLILQHFARLSEAQHGQSIGHLFQRQLQVV